MSLKHFFQFYIIKTHNQQKKKKKKNKQNTSKNGKTKT